MGISMERLLGNRLSNHLGMFPISSVQVILHKLPRKTILRLGDVLFSLVNHYLQRA